MYLLYRLSLPQVLLRKERKLSFRFGYTKCIKLVSDHLGGNPVFLVKVILGEYFISAVWN